MLIKTIKSTFFILLAISSVNLMASDLPEGLASCKYQDSYKLISMTEVDFTDNIGNRVDGCPREMIYRYNLYSSPNAQVLRLNSAKYGNKCFYGIIECTKTKP